MNESLRELLNDRRRTAGLLFLAAFLSLSTILSLRQISRQGDLVASDGIGYFVHLPSIIVDGDIDYRNNLERFGYHDRNHWPIGTAISWSGAYLLGHAVSVVKEGLELQAPQEGQGFPEQLACCLATIAYGSATLALTYLMLTRWFEPLPSLLATVGLLSGTNLWYYLLCEPYMSHGASTFWVTVILYLGLTDEPLTAKRAVLIGLAAGLAALTRPQDGLALVVPIVWHLSQNVEQLKKTFTLLFLSGIISLGVFSLQLYIWKGQIEPAPTSIEASAPLVSDSDGKAEDLLHVVPGGGHNWTSPQFGWALLNTGSGLWTWHPITLAAFVGLLQMAGLKRRLVLTLLTGFFTLLYVVAAWSGQGQSFGSRMMCSAFPIMAPGLAYFCTRYPKTAKVLLALAAVLNLFFAWRYRQLIAQGAPHISIWIILNAR